jgi:anhydro-N-acetylmuramic acid kinase
MLPTAWRWLADYAVAKERLVIGLISGTSADGVDAALVRVVGMAPQRVETLAFTTLPYPADLRRVVLQASHDGDAATLCWLHFALGELFAEAARRVAELARVPLQRVCLIGSHGQTVRHLPPPLRRARRVRRFARMGTLQLASPAVIALRTGVPVVSDFRAKDMAAGGQGAPLVSLVDWLLLRHPHKTRVALNLGGIANLTVLPAGVGPDRVVAFDTGPGNILIDGAVRHFSRGARTYDRDGAWARKGQVDSALLQWLMRHPFLRQPPPKSTGREMFGDAFLQQVVARARRRRLTPHDVVMTLTAFTAASIVDAIVRFVLPRAKGVDELIVSGGGAKNPVLMALLQEQLPTVSVHRSDALGIDPDAKEAIAFAVLAHRTVMGLTGNLPAATGAHQPVILGSVTLPE